MAEQFDHLDEENPVITLQGARVTNFNGQGLTMDQDAKLEFNPKLEEVKKLKEWFADADKSKFKALSQKGLND